MACPKSYTSDGFELQFGTNHLGHFLLTILLLDLLKHAAPSRIVIVSSEGHKFSDINRDDLMSEKSYNKYKAYSQSKLANILFAKELAKKLEGTNVTVNSCHPGKYDIYNFVDQKLMHSFHNYLGVVQTELGRYMNENVRRFLIRPLFSPFMKTPKEGAQTQITLAVDPQLEKVTGKYFSNCKEKTPSRAARNDETARWLYEKSIELVGME